MTDHHNCAPFPELVLSPADKHAMRQATRAYLAEGVEEYMQFLRHHTDRCLPPDEWKVLDEQEDLRIYTQRKHKRDRNDHGHGRRHISGRNALSKLIGVGTVRGRVSNCMLGQCAPTPIKLAYAKESGSHDAVLAELQVPKTHKPFRSMRIRWHANKPDRSNLNLLFHSSSKPHDMTFIEATGFTTLLNGEHVAFSLVHSIELPELPELKEFTRVNMSMITLWRTFTKEHTEVFMKAYIDVSEDHRSRTLRHLARSLSGLAHMNDVGHLQKLAWMLHCKSLREVPKQLADEPAYSKMCVECGASVRRRTCALCDSGVCLLCRVGKRVYAVSPENPQRVEAYDVRLCRGCWEMVEREDATSIATDKLLLPRRPSKVECELAMSLASMTLQLSPTNSDRETSIEASASDYEHDTEL